VFVFVTVVCLAGMSVKVRVPEGKAPGDVLQLQVPQALMDPEFRAKQAVRDKTMRKNPPVPKRR